MNATQTFSVIVSAGTPPPNPIVITPANADDSLAPETEGVATSDPVCTVSGGVPPYTYAFEGQPAGVTFQETDNGDGTFSITTQGTPDAGDAAESPYEITLTVTDSSPAPQTAKAARKIG